MAKQLRKRIKTSGGRNARGRITVRHRGGGSRRLYRVVDFGQSRQGKSGTVSAIEYDPNRNARLALVSYEDKTKSYVLASHGLAVGQAVDERKKLKDIPPGTFVYNVELQPGRGGQVARGAGTSVQVAAHEGIYTQLVMPSSEIRKVLSDCAATIGTVSNPEYRYRRVKNAGSNRNKGIRPRVRGVAMNPVDHPHGGGEGRSPIGMKRPKTPWGKPALGVKTRKKKKWTDSLIVQRRKPKKRKK
jgi:large subunit ribosomal protein L2